MHVFRHRSVVNFINVKCSNFLYKHHFGSFYHVHVTRKKLPKWCSYEKFACLTLMKLKPVVNFINIKCTNFLYECCFGSFYYIHVTGKKLQKWRAYKKFACLTFMKMTPGGRSCFESTFRHEKFHQLLSCWTNSTVLDRLEISWKLPSMEFQLLSICIV